MTITFAIYTAVKATVLPVIAETATWSALTMTVLSWVK